MSTKSSISLKNKLQDSNSKKEEADHEPNEYASSDQEQSSETAQELGDKEGQEFTCWNDLANAEDHMRRIVEREEEAGHPDLERDRNTLKYIQGVISYCEIEPEPSSPTDMTYEEGDETVYLVPSLSVVLISIIIGLCVLFYKQPLMHNLIEYIPAALYSASDSSPAEYKAQFMNRLYVISIQEHHA